jgi:hypothetical protein
MNICPHCGGNQFIDRDGNIVCRFCGTQVGQREVATVESKDNEGILLEVATLLLADISFVVGFLLIVASFWNSALVPIQTVVLCVALLMRIIRLCVSRVDSGYHTWMFFSQAIILLFTYMRLLQLR